MLRTTTPALIAVSVLLSATPLSAQQEQAAPPPEISVVTGLAPGDMLNVRATASALGKVQGRLPNGANLNIFGCSEVSGYVWCRVEEAGNPQLSGWAPGRYLHTPGGELPPPTDVAAVEQAASRQRQETAQTQPDATPADPLTEGANGNNIFVAGPAPDADSADAPPQQAASAEPPADSASAGPAAPDVPNPSLPADLMARFGEGTGQMAGEAAQPKSAAAIGRTAAADAYALAFAAQGGATAQDGASADEIADSGYQASPASDETAAAPGGDGVPLPTPRPDGETGSETVAALDPQPVGAAQPAPAGEIPCARYVGQPMTRCEARVTHTGADAADIAVIWPDGGTRVISFQGGKPSGSNSRGAFRFTREGNLNMIRVGASERFEILDELAFGE